ncbi:hypothetical protein AOA12_07250 [Microbacterium sp. No. 7]|nr:hypothetical protein AOA12_07250 [Microbacterium sp. No. 7]
MRRVACAEQDFSGIPGVSVGCRRHPREISCTAHRAGAARRGATGRGAARHEDLARRARPGAVTAAAIGRKMVS